MKMPWVSLGQLKQYIIDKILLEKGSLNGESPFTLDKMITTYPRREMKLPCGCKSASECECSTMFHNGLWVTINCEAEYEYFIES